MRRLRPKHVYLGNFPQKNLKKTSRKPMRAPQKNYQIRPNTVLVSWGVAGRINDRDGLCCPAPIDRHSLRRAKVVG
ncbi:hypothetical protein TBK1r_61680 [Stieleria magnilauensis]|uniref:Uncharacterized protein n=1 Tax=Stieleria magnilauensis TaxID=2527963 RepID=A0ABX5Y072_9BACT|nr:hypothetical protein TBK1r_61680 [Planctomycetes bacterium TBK1r]